jgi:hypothetical protein
MVVVEIRRPYFDEESQTIEWQTRAVVVANSDGVKISPSTVDEAPCVLAGAVVEASSGESVDAESAPERWARSLPDAYRSGDLVAVVTHDDHPAPVDSLDDGANEPTIPEPPTPEFSETSETHSGEVTTVS